MSITVLKGLVRFANVAAVFISGIFAYQIYGLPNVPTAQWEQYALLMGLGSLIAANSFELFGLYSFDALEDLRGKSRELLLSVSTTFAVLILVIFLSKMSDHFSRVWIVIWYFLGLIFLFLIWHYFLKLIRHGLDAGRLVQNVIVLGAGPCGKRLISQLIHRDEQTPHVQILGVFDDRLKRVPRRVENVRRLGSFADVIGFVQQNRVDQIIIALPWTAETRIMDVLERLKLLPVDILLCPDMAGFRFGHCSYSRMGGISLLNVVNRPLRDWNIVVKDMEDRGLAVFLLFLCLPLIMIVALAIKFESRGPVLFWQNRRGFNNEIIRVCKFRTMRDDFRDEDGEVLTKRNDPRVTRVGNFLRRSSIDELPQLLNVLKGEMSIVGPRPHAISAKAGGKAYDQAVMSYAARHRVKPGITGWAQINGWRGETDTIEKLQRRVEHDLYYIEHWSVIFDLKILSLTPIAVLKGRNAV